jgi:hypothetical protein
MYKYISYIYSNTYFTKTNIGQVLSSRIAQMQGFSECYWLQIAHLPKVLLTILYVKGLDVMLLDKREL